MSVSSVLFLSIIVVNIVILALCILVLARLLLAKSEINEELNRENARLLRELAEKG